MKASVYNQFAKQLNLKTVSIREQEAIKIVPPEENDGINRLEIEGNSIQITEDIRVKLLQDLGVLFLFP
ncbi:hypothetical protein [Paenibacillus sp. Root444D2]|uniref:hypothetical protein n=1 Tax=Paenibacillus sp. Root444D2 TaxID=1736538 RepID=UPI0007108FA9|nr:hypothetical protein [Paenibacillus sp. Root444D2]KQX45966.1 hypothetical protein ASD40_19255 [Paenibacillus sp. Root444D2]